MKELKKRTNVVENSIEAYALRACGCGCGCDCACGCSSSFPTVSTRNSTSSNISSGGKINTRIRVQ